jgi:hypothetical protein
MYRDNLFSNPNKIVDLFDKLYNHIADRNKFLTKVRFYSIQRFSVRVIANLFIPLYYKLTKNNKSAKLSDTDSHVPVLIVSLTTFPARIKRVWIVIESILRQTHKPDRIILWLSKEQFGSMSELPKNLLDLCNRGLEIRFCDQDYKSHKKYYYALKEYPEDIMVTFDDDIIYPTFLIAQLVSLHKKYPESVCCHRGLVIKTNKNKILPYIEWPALKKDVGTSYRIFQTSGGGTLFPPHSLHNEVLNYEVFTKFCFYADDIWLNIMCYLNDVTIVTSDFHSDYLPVINLKNQMLSSINVDLFENDKQLENVRNYYIEKAGIDAFKKLFA